MCHLCPLLNMTLLVLRILHLVMVISSKTAYGLRFVIWFLRLHPIYPLVEVGLAGLQCICILHVVLFKDHCSDVSAVVLELVKSLN